MNAVQLLTDGLERILDLRLNTTRGPLSHVSVYAPTLIAFAETKDELYENLASTIKNIHSKEQLLQLGEFNARLGVDHESWPSSLGKFGIGKNK